MIHKRKVETMDADTRSRQELDRNFMNTGYRRRLLVSSDPGFSWRGRPTRSFDPLTVVPIPVVADAGCRLRYLGADGSPRVVELEAGHSYYIPPEVPHQFEARGLGAIEIYSPIPADGRLFKEEVLPEDFFQLLEAAKEPVR